MEQDDGEEQQDELEQHDGLEQLDEQVLHGELVQHDEQHDELVRDEDLHERE